MDIKARAFYTANGTIEGFRNEDLNIISAGAQTIIDIAETDVTREVRQNFVSINWPRAYDPLAQTFRVNDSNGVIITSVGLFFAAEPSENIPVTVQIRPVVNGYPDSINVLAETALIPSAISVSTTSSFLYRSNPLKLFKKSLNSFR